MMWEVLWSCMEKLGGAGWLVGTFIMFIRKAKGTLASLQAWILHEQDTSNVAEDLT